MNTIASKELLEIGIALSQEKDRNKLFYLIVESAMRFTNCDGGTLYTCDKEKLTFKIMITRSQDIHRGGKGEVIDIPPVPMQEENVCACCAMKRKVINIPDVYQETEYDFFGPRRYDAITGYHTRSMLVVPMENDRGDIIGVLQLMNAQNEQGEIVAFDEDVEKLIQCLASQTAISLTNANYAKELEELLESFVRVMSAAIDARTPYNANHTRSMAVHGRRFLEYLEKSGHPWRFSETKKKEFLMCIWLHDVGKLVIPLEVMNKESRLGSGLERIKQRFREMELLNRLALAEGKITEEVYKTQEQEYKETLLWIEKVNTAEVLSDEDMERTGQISERYYQNEYGESIPWLTEHEKDCLRIRKGTLLPAERKIMENHVVMTQQFLKEIEFSKEYRDVPVWAVSHHEFLDGSGYPEGLKEEEICQEVRLLTVLDIFDSLIAEDRPYRPPMPVEKALAVLESMVSEGKLDKDMVALFKESKAWEEERK